MKSNEIHDWLVTDISERLGGAMTEHPGFQPSETEVEDMTDAALDALMMHLDNLARSIAETWLMLDMPTPEAEGDMPGIIDAMRQGVLEALQNMGAHYDARDACLDALYAEHNFIAHAGGVHDWINFTTYMEEGLRMSTMQQITLTVTLNYDPVKVLNLKEWASNAITDHMDFTEVHVVKESASETTEVEVDLSEYLDDHELTT